ncbi:MAG: hypothetical protein J7K81_00580 [Methanophagales archaeon]|nr:hypothetical protein [Methanophagales archaeon]
MELTDELYLYFTGSHVTSDFIVDCLGDFLYSTGYNFFRFHFGWNRVPCVFRILVYDWSKEN